MAEAIRHKRTDVPEEWVQYVDASVLARIPQGFRPKSIFPHGVSYWAQTAEILTEEEDGSPRSFFLKVARDTSGKGMVAGEFVSLSSIHDLVPDLTPKPIAWGTYNSNPNAHFLLCPFVDVNDEIPDIQKFTAKIAELHKKSISPFRTFGATVTTYLGKICEESFCSVSWEAFFSDSMKTVLRAEEESQGTNAEMQQLSKALIEKVIPRLLRPLETGGKQIQPCLVHGNLWDGNTSTNVATDTPVIFDAACIYAHNECKSETAIYAEHAKNVVELAPWRSAGHKMGKAYIKAYHDHFPVSFPKVDHDDRNALYSIRFNAVSSALYPENPQFRRIFLNEMRRLVEKFPDGYEGWNEKRAKNNQIIWERHNQTWNQINATLKRSAVKTEPM